ncbi:MAG: TraR/DksA family transcriptional regulator [Alphaproteobacteria bacterium]|nr:TraR/DksA family transcriptional regulator [Alphaproteobacteria bacterium]
MKLGNRDFELADRRFEEERAAGVAAIRAALAGNGSPACMDCGDPIPVQRRMAVPNARRCADCQDLRERGRRA